MIIWDGNMEPSRITRFEALDEPRNGIYFYLHAEPFDRFGKLCVEAKIDPINTYADSWNALHMGGWTRSLDRHAVLEPILSAAPEMLEVLQNFENDDGRVPEPIWKMRNDAIEKATGGQLTPKFPNDFFTRHMESVRRAGYLEGIMLGVAQELEAKNENELAKHLRDQANKGSLCKPDAIGGG